MNPILYRYKDTESVIKVMDGYTPGDGWLSLYGADEVKAATDERLKELEAEIAQLRAESEERLQNCVAQVAENERLRAAPATAPEQPRPFIPWSKEAEMLESWAAQPATAPAQPALERKPMTDEEVIDLVRECGLDWHKGFMPLFDDDPTNRFAVLVRAVEASHDIKDAP